MNPPIPPTPAQAQLEAIRAAYQAALLRYHGYRMLGYSPRKALALAMNPPQFTHSLN